MINMTREEALQKAIDAAMECENTLNQLQLSLAWSAIAALLPKQSSSQKYEIVEEEEVEYPGTITISVEELWEFFEQDGNGYYKLKEDAPEWTHKKWGDVLFNE